jgi:hypothetical protein
MLPTKLSDTQLFNIFNHPNFALPSNQAGTPDKPATQTGFGTLSNTIFLDTTATWKSKT